MYLSRKLAVVVLFICACACVYENVQGKEDDVEGILKSYSNLAIMASKDPSFINPFRFLFRILLFITAPARFVLRFFSTIFAVLILSVANCQIFPETTCSRRRMLELIPEVMADLKTDMDFYIGLAQNAEAAE